MDGQTDRWTDEQMDRWTDQSDFIGRCLNNIKRPTTIYNSDVKILLYFK